MLKIFSFILAFFLILSSIIPVYAFTPRDELDWVQENYDIFASNHNPQDKINAKTVNDLEIDWVNMLSPAPQFVGGYSVAGSELSSPLIINGSVFIGTSYGRIFSLDAKSGNINWMYDIPTDRLSDLEENLPIMLNPAMPHIHSLSYFEGKLYFPSPPCNIHFIDFNTGEFAGEIQNICDVGSDDGNIGLFKGPQSAAPSISEKDRVLIIPGGSVIEANLGGRGFIAGYDIDTLELLWRFFITPEAGGDPEWVLRVADKGWIAGKKASSLPVDALINDWGKSGTDGSQSGASRGQWAVDEETGIAYIATAQPSPAGNATYRPGPNVFSASVLALKVRTGELLWWHQVNPNDTVGWDCNWNTALGKFDQNNEKKKIVFKFCEHGVMNAFDAATGELVWTFDPPSTKRCEGCFVKDPEDVVEMKRPWINHPEIAPILRNPASGFGLEGELALAYGMVYVATYNFWDYVQTVPVDPSLPWNSGYAELGDPFLPANTTIHALDALSGEVIWSYFIPHTGYRTSLVASGGLIFATPPNGQIYALDAYTGDEVWIRFTGFSHLENIVIGSDSDGEMRLFMMTGGLANSWISGLPLYVPGLILSLKVSELHSLDVSQSSFHYNYFGLFLLFFVIRKYVFT